MGLYPDTCPEIKCLSNENRNRAAVRTYFPKGTDFDDIPDEYIEFAEHLHNSKPMKVLGFYTPDEIWVNELKKYLAACPP